MDAQTRSLVTAVIFGFTYVGLALGGLPGLRIDRAGIALVGASAMMAAGVLRLDESFEAVDPGTVALLLAMMILVAYLRLAGFFGLAADWLARHEGSPLRLLALTVFVSGLLSALLVNDVVCVAMTPLVLDLCRRTRRPPIPYLIGLATASNIGSVATITGNPQNMIIGSLSEISFLRFAERLTPVAVVGLVIDIVLIAVVYRRSLFAPVPVEAVGPRPVTRVDRPLLVKGLIVMAGVIGLFFSGLPTAVVALAGSSLMLLGRVRPEKVYRIVDWPLLLMFAGLFIVVHGFEVEVVRSWEIERWEVLRRSPVVLVSLLSAGLSNLVSNVPAVLLFRPLMEVVSEPETAWLALAMSSTLAGNLTLLGSVANLIVVENARRSGIVVGFLEYLKVGVPLTLLTILVGILWLKSS